MKSRITSRQYFQTLNLTFYMQTFTLLLFMLVVLFLIYSADGQPDREDQVQWRYVVPVVVIIALATAHLVFRMMVKRIDPNLRLQAKVPKYASALLVRTALLELPGFLAAIVAYITLQPYFLGATVLVLVALVMLRPTRDSIAQDLNLSLKEKEMLDKDDAVISEVDKR